PVPITIDESGKKKIQDAQKEAPLTDSEETESDDEIEILAVKKGKPMASKGSNRVAGRTPIHKEKVKEKKSVKVKTVRKKNVEKKREVEKEVPTSNHKESRTKNKHDRDENDDELLSEMLSNAKETKRAAEECEKLRQQAKKKGDSRGVDPSSQKKKKTEKKAAEKKKEKETKETYFDSSESEDEELVVKALPADLIWRKRVIRCKMFRESWMMDDGLSNVMDLIKRQKWEKLFKRRELMHNDAVKEFYARLILVHYKKKDVARSSVRGVDIEFDHLRLASILGVPGHNGIYEYIQDVWEESKYIKPLEITRKFANDNMIMEARRVSSIEMKPFQRFVHFLVMKNVGLRFGKRDTTSYMDLIYMEHLVSRRLVNLPRVMMRHMSYVISMKDHELPYGDWLIMVFEAFGVPLVDKQEEEPKRYDYFEETFLTMCQLRRDNRVWWLGTGDHRRRDDDVEEVNDDEQAVNEEEQNPDFDWEVVVDEAALQGESGSDDQFYDAQVEVEEPVAEAPAVPVFPASPGDSTNQQKELEAAGVDPSGPTGFCHEQVAS
ncbi:hypothetical protein Dimus_016038, partial [Dionaea muscipula]